MTGACAILGLGPGLPPPDEALVARLRGDLHASGPFSGAGPAPRATDDAIEAALVALVPDAIERQRRAGIPEPITRATLLDVGRKHRLYGAGSVLPWLIQILRGDVVELGRLQVEVVAGPLGHALHVPETGPLLPDAVDASLDRIRAFLDSGGFCCTSWLLDPAVRTELPRSNIAAFAARFRIVRSGAPGGGAEAAAKFVFRRPLSEVIESPALHIVTSLERLVAARLRAGYAWVEPTGVLRVP